MPQKILLYPDRKRQALKLIMARPGVATLEISRELGLTLTSTFHVITDLWHAGLIEHYGEGWRYVSAVRSSLRDHSIAS